ncbi:PREDICTED: protein TENP-like [Chaetura pelagica]|uniref:protein TENP-like n=1 Tax=Chaetura pelagica TaxID=8897 RepID=UPI0005236381|nr:PREDICTED: protein TENP-like [Chaetura pelagica]
MGMLVQKGAGTATLRTLSILLSLLVPAPATRSPDCGGILTPSGLSYFAEVSKPHAERVLRQDLMAPAAPETFLGSPKPSRNQINSVSVAELSLSLVPHAGLRLSIDADLSISPTPSTTTVTRLSILADLHVEMNPEGNLELVTSACRPTLEGSQSIEEIASKSSDSDLDKEINIDKICLEVSKLLLLPNERLISLSAQFPITPSCQLQYLPLAVPMFSEQGITISLQTIFQVAGMAIPLPVSPMPFSMPEPASSSPSHLILAFSEHFYASLFFALEMSGTFNMTLLSPLTTATLAEHIPQDVAAGLLLSVTDTRMMVTAAGAEDVELSLAASNVGPVPAALLEQLFLPTIREEVPAQLNAVLSEGVFLPHIFSFTYTNFNVTIHRDYVLVSCNLKFQEQPGGTPHPPVLAGAGATGVGSPITTQEHCFPLGTGQVPVTSS